MALPKINPTTTKAWESLQKHFYKIHNTHMKDLFAQDSERANKFTLKWDDFYVDVSKNRITEYTLELLLQLANEVKLKNAIQSYFSGEKINETEGRAVLHTALRAPETSKIYVDGQNIVPEISQVKEKIKTFSEAIINGKIKGYTGKPFETIVNIGIGGSDLGPSMVVDALQFYKNHLEVRFINNIDGDSIGELTKILDPETTLFIIVSKTFTTQETLSNAETLKAWFLKSANDKAIAKHFVAVSANIEKVNAFGIDSSNIFPIWNWVGGRYSLWSAVGLTISLSLGYSHFENLLLGAHKADTHFKNEDFSTNIPVILALLSIWYNNFFESESEAIIPYTQYLNQFPQYLQQTSMESNGKTIDRNGLPVNYQTGTIIWGASGTNSQHSFFQLIHQGTKLVPIDFIGFKKSLYNDKSHHDKLLSNFIGQTEALLNGKTKEEVVYRLKEKQFSESEIENVSSFKVSEGNKPTNTLIINQLTPESLGKLIAIYEHKTFVQGIIWNIFSFDQFGVELGKELSKDFLDKFTKKSISKNYSSSSLNNIKYLIN